MLAESVTTVTKTRFVVDYELAISGYVSAYFTDPADVEQQIGISHIIRTLKVGFFQDIVH